MSTPISSFTAHDIAGTYNADRVQFLVVDETTVLAIGYREGRTATGRVAWVTLDEVGALGQLWRSRRRSSGMAAPVDVSWIDTDDDLDALVRWLRGDA